MNSNNFGIFHIIIIIIITLSLSFSLTLWIPHHIETNRIIRACRNMHICNYLLGHLPNRAWALAKCSVTDADTTHSAWLPKLSQHPSPNNRVTISVAGLQISHHSHSSIPIGPFPDWTALLMVFLHLSLSVTSPNCTSLKCFVLIDILTKRASDCS